MKNNISMKDFYEKYTDDNSEKLPILDVRETHEYAAGHIPSAESFPLSTLGADFSKLDKDQKYYVICQAGGRSAKAYDFLDAQGFDVINVEGSMNNWPGETK